MLIKFLKHIPEFSNATRAELDGLVRASTILCIPERRWIVQSERNLGAYFYLLKGTLETFQPTALLKSGRVRRHVYPGCVSVKTRTACQILRVDAAHRDLIVAKRQGYARETHGQWLTHFLESKMMKGLTKSEWQQLLSGSREFAVDTGEVVVALGHEGAECFVIERGRARVHRGQRTLRKVGPGDFFGEDAVVARAPRNATVTALEPMVLHAIDGGVFCKVAVPKLVTTVTCASGGIKLNLGVQQQTGAVPIDPLTIRDRAYSFDPKERYFLVGGGWHERTLCAFLLAQRGLQASVVSNQRHYKDELLT